MKWFILFFCMFIGHCEAFGNLADLASKMNPLNMMFQNKCMEDLGCFHSGGHFFSPPVRPLSVAPQDCPNPKFMLYTKANPKNAYLLTATPSSLQKSHFNPSVKTMVFSHGFKFKVTPQDAQFKTKDELLKQGDYNIIVVDWSEYNGEPYPQAVANTRVVGARIAKLLTFLIKHTGTQPQSMHCIGHSLGAHICGYVGERIPNFGRVTGLDPAGPFFQKTNPIVRLDPTDAIFVDIIHTNGAESMLSGLGTTDAIGHMDFYPNGGRKQPGCDNATGDEAPPSDPAAIFGRHKCHHMRANKYFMASVNPSCRFQSVQCNSYAEFQSGKCRSSSIVSPMGMYAEKKPGVKAGTKLFLETSAAPPYCLG